MIDDIGQREPSPAFQDFLYLIIDSRMNKNLGTIFTTNFSVGLLRERFGDPIVSRICSGEVLKFDGEDKRAALF